MPELAEVAYYASQWHPLLGREITGIETHATSRVFRQCPEANWERLMGDSLLRIETHGKHIFVTTAKGTGLHIHLGMTGKLASQRIEDFISSPHDRLVIRTGDLIGRFNDSRHFGLATLASESGQEAFRATLPPSISSPQFTVENLQARLSDLGRSPIKTKLLDQSIFPGIGNWMADEILWRCRINPFTPANTLNTNTIKAIHHHTCEVAEDAMGVIAHAWGAPPDSWLFNHRWKDGGTCPATGRALKRERIQGRTCCWSPHWQTLP